MIRRRLPAVATAVVAALLAPSSPPRGAAAQGSTATSTMTDAYNASGLELLQQFSASAGNIVLSPYSIGSAMSMALSGARGATGREMLGVLKHRLKREEIEAASREVIATLHSYDRSGDRGSCPDGMQLVGQRCQTTPRADGRCPNPLQLEGDQCFGAAAPPPSAKLLVANALMSAKAGMVALAYAALLQDKYAAELFGNAGLADINGWVNRKTEGKIDKILDQLDSPAVVLLNAVYFKSRWASPFNERLTKDGAFNLSRTQQVQIPVMNDTGDYALVPRQNYRAIRLPYVVQALGMIVVLPNEVDGLSKVIERIDAKEQSELFSALRGWQAHKPVALALPRFKSEFKAGLVEPFKRAGMKLAFDPERADFSGMTGGTPSRERLYINQIVHRALVDVTEESTEAAAATAVIMAPTGMLPPRPQPEVFRVDRPFLFYIVDDATGAVLFAGRIADPRQAAASR